MSKTAHILALEYGPDSRGPERGFTPTASLDPSMDKATVWLGPRPHLEERMPIDGRGFLQVIPYTLVFHGREVLTYRRAASGGEARLHDRISIGLGGHVDGFDCLWDAKGAIDFRATVLEAAKRELHEEIGIEIDHNRLLVLGRVYDDSQPVNAVHYGIALRYELTDAERAALVFEDAVGEASFQPVEALASSTVDGTIEDWSVILISAMTNDKDLRP